MIGNARPKFAWDDYLMEQAIKTWLIFLVFCSTAKAKSMKIEMISISNNLNIRN